LKKTKPPQRISGYFQQLTVRDTLTRWNMLCFNPPVNHFLKLNFYNKCTGHSARIKTHHITRWQINHLQDETLIGQGYPISMNYKFIECVIKIFSIKNWLNLAPRNPATIDLSGETL